MNIELFDAIRPYSDSEIQSALGRITGEKSFLRILADIYPNQDLTPILAYFGTVDSVDTFQRTIIYPYLGKIARDYCSEVTCKGIGHLKENPARLLLSNHRDIVLDSALMCKCLIDNGVTSSEIAIGDNLLIYPWIEDLVRINKSFIVRRGGGVREMLTNSQRLSAYIRYAITEKKVPVWLAQREGRAKDSNDRTQDSLLKMLLMSGKGDLVSNIEELDITPLSISYEYDPCDYLKAKEFQQKRDNPNYKKSPQDDLASMATGVTGYKGRVVFHFTAPIAAKLPAITAQGVDKKEQIVGVAKLIDQQIHAAYEIFPGNKVAYDEFLSTERFSNEYTAEERAHFNDYLQQQLDKIDLPNRDVDFLRHKLLEMYANPVINHLEAVK